MIDEVPRVDEWPARDVSDNPLCGRFRENEVGRAVVLEIPVRLPGAGEALGSERVSCVPNGSGLVGGQAIMIETDHA